MSSLFDSTDWLRIKAAGLYSITTEMLETAMGDFVEEQSLLIIDLKSSYINFGNNHMLKLEQIPLEFHSTEVRHNIKKLNEVLFTIKFMVRKF